MSQMNQIEVEIATKKKSTLTQFCIFSLFFLYFLSIFFPCISLKFCKNQTYNILNLISWRGLFIFVSGYVLSFKRMHELKLNLNWMYSRQFMLLMLWKELMTIFVFILCFILKGIVTDVMVAKCTSTIH